MLDRVNQLLDKPDCGKLVLRLSFSILVLFHGVHKLIAGVGGIQGMLAAHGLPGFIAYGVFIGEVIAPVLMILGILTRPAALSFAFTMIVAFALAHPEAIFTLDKTGAWGIENVAVYFFAGIAIALLGSGKYSVMSNPRWR
ncbi:DoxX family protein [Dickeya chrysanthemi]|uniref:DoxX family protein n=1 Tax=Dickeya TaxID=204037 RepID=UPI0003A24D0F|nr:MULTISPECIES: DoxX family protein [Dickeya]TYL43446.1 DoxX family protein [Dickeya sp. ws52]WJM86607.1 DoxX family protein [Dickeya chrysanthemi]